jgi:hypothetical protein
MVDSTAVRYLRLGLQAGRHVDGIVDAYFGPPGLAGEAESAPPVPPRDLADAAAALLVELSDGWLRDQVRGLHAFAATLAGEEIPYADEVEACYGVRPRRTAEDVYAAAHERLEELLPGAGPLAARHARWEESIRVPLERIEPTVAAVIGEARAQTRELVALPDGEGVVLEIVRREPWLAYCEYLGDVTSRISVNVDLPISALELLVLTLHETYPGHHTERCCKEEALVRGRGLLEETLVLVPTPQSLVAEGIATTAPRMLLEADDARALVDAVRREAGVSLDLDHALAVDAALEPCRWAYLDAALLLHGEGAADDEVKEYMQQWGLVTPEVAAHMTRFLREPTSRTYVVTYLAGRDLCRAYVGRDQARFRRLLTEQVRVSDLAAPAA